MNAIVPVPPASIQSQSPGALLRTFLSGRSARTLEAYRGDLEDFRRWAGAGSIEDAALKLLAGAPGDANALALAYRAALIDRGLSAATVNRRLAALRSLVSLARTLGLVVWSLEVPSVRQRPYRDTRGPGHRGFARLLEELDGRTSAKAIRDRAILHLLYDLALRRGEVVSLDLEHVDLDAGTVAVRGKGESDRDILTAPAETVAALRDWIDVRGPDPGPLFTALDRTGVRARLSGRSVARILEALEPVAGVRARPHGLRHAAITTALNLTNGNTRAVQRFSRHRDVRTLIHYDDNREDLGGEVARLVAAAAGVAA